MVLDIAGLVISVPEFIWTIINFFLLMFLLKKILYVPVLRVLDERAAEVAEGLEEGRAAEKALHENEEALRAELTASSAEAREIIGHAKAEAEKTKGKTVADAHAQAASIQAEVRRTVSEDEEKVRAELEAGMPELVAALTARLLHSDNADMGLIESCIQAAKE